jgi:RNA polymerase sigma-70 factor (ECF subfamily)
MTAMHERHGLPPGPDTCFDAPGDPLDDALDGALQAEAADPAGPAPEATRAAAPTAPPVSDAQLAAWIDRMVDRDERALAALYDATLPRVYGLVLHLVRRPALADEVVEDAFFQAWRQAPRFEPSRGTALAWLLAMARSRAIDALRHEARFVHEPIDAGAEPAEPDPQPPADALLDAARQHAELHRALLQLGAQPRQLVALAFFRGLSHEEIAEQTRLPLGTVKSQIRRALITLRGLLGPSGAPPLPV